MSRLGRSVRVCRSAAMGAVAVLLAQCDQDRSAVIKSPAPEVVPPIEVDTGTLTPPPLLGRAELIAALAQAASVFAAGATVAGSDPLVGRSFSLRLPFGCNGPTIAGEANEGLAHWQWGEGQASLRLSLTPGDWLASPFVAGSTSDGNREAPTPTWEAVEGFWIARPWMATDACPVAGLSSSISAPPSPQTVGLVAIFPEDSSRLSRRDGRAYQYTIRGKGDVPPVPPAGGFALRLEGRVVSFPNGRASRCVAFSPDQRPTCVVAVRLDRVAFEGGTTGNPLSEWRLN